MMHARTLCCCFPWFLGALSFSAAGATLQVGPGQSYAMPCQAIAAASDGDTILIDAAGNYAGDVCTLRANNLTLRGVNGRPHIDAAGHAAQQKAIWVINGNNTSVDNIEFSGCFVADRNGAGIRLQATNLSVRNAWFHDNQNGILNGSGRHSNGNVGSTIVIEHSEFGPNGEGDGQSHNIYIGKVDRLVFRYNWSHKAIVGHLLKSRALENIVAYNRLTGEAGSDESYELSFPSGGVAYVIGNIMEQPATSPNSTILDYLSEPGSANAAPDHLYVVNNTVINDKHSGTFVQIGSTVTSPAMLSNNIFWGGGKVTNRPSKATLDHNYTGSDPLFVDRTQYDYRLVPAATQIIDAGIDPGSVAGQTLRPTQVYVHPASAAPRPVMGRIDIGAYEWPADSIFADGFD